MGLAARQLPAASFNKLRGDRDLDAAEAAWWERYADVEEEFCWVQTPAIQSFLRGHYLRQIVRSVPHGARVLEVGCGAGWLCLLLARFGAREVVGIDPSPAQIERARATARRSGLADRVRFHVGTFAPTGHQDFAGRFDVLILHAVLHHLSDGEIHDLLSTFSARFAGPGARVFVVEPVQHRDAGVPRSRWDHLIDRLILLPRMGQRSGLRRTSPTEAALAAKIDGRGDSPKEAPFRPAELEALLASHLHVYRATPVLNFSYLGAKNALLFRVSHPICGSLFLWPYLALLRVIETYLLRFRPRAVWLPVFTLFESHLPPSIPETAGRCEMILKTP